MGAPLSRKAWTSVLTSCLVFVRLQRLSKSACTRPPSARSMHWMDSDAAMESPGWEQLPSGLLSHIAYMVGGAQGLAASTTLLRLVCRGWRVGLPLCESGSGGYAARSINAERNIIGSALECARHWCCGRKFWERRRWRTD